MIIIPTMTILIKANNNLGFTAFRNIIIDGKDNTVTRMINAKIVPKPAPSVNKASAIRSVPK